jgi:hypothetical protein
MLGADLIVIGSVVKIGNSYTINSRTIDTKTGEATLGKNVTGSDLNLLTTLSRTLLRDLFGTGTTREDSGTEKARDPSGESSLRIIKATYGVGNAQMEVTEILRRRITNNQLAINVNNNVFGHDPFVGMRKKCLVRYQTENGIFETSIPEDQTIVIPDSRHTRIERYQQYPREVG